MLRVLSLSLLLCACVLVPTASAANPGDVVVNEIMFNTPTTSDTEWVELYNTTDAMISMDAMWTLHDNTPGRAFTFGGSLGGTPLPAHGYITVQISRVAPTYFTPTVDASAESLTL